MPHMSVWVRIIRNESGKGSSLVTSLKNRIAVWCKGNFSINRICRWWKTAKMLQYSRDSRYLERGMGFMTPFIDRKYEWNCDLGELESESRFLLYCTYCDDLSVSVFNEMEMKWLNKTRKYSGVQVIKHRSGCLILTCLRLLCLKSLEKKAGQTI